MKRKGLNKPAPARQAPTPRGVAPTKTSKSVPSAKRAHSNVLTLDPMKYAQSLIRDVADFPRPGILFKDVTPLLGDPKAFAIVMDALSSRFVGEPLDAVVGIEARGFIFGSVLAARLNLPFVPVRKPGKLPADTHAVSYDLEYGSAELHIHQDAIESGARVLVVDDLLATGGTAAASGELVRRLGGQVVCYVFAIELGGLGGRDALAPTPVFSLIHYD